VANEFDLQRIGPGLLSFFGLVGRGKNPFTLSPQVTPVIDVSGMYGTPYETAFAVSSIAQTQGTTVSLPVPAGQCWFVHAAHAQYTINTAADVAADGVAVSLSVSYPGVSGLVHLKQARMAPVGVGGAVAGAISTVAGIYFDRPFVAIAGTNMHAVLQRTVGQAGTLIVRLLFRRLDQ
jgi:hypothetical protein